MIGQLRTGFLGLLIFAAGSISLLDDPLTHGAAPDKAEVKWKKLFDGKSLEGWKSIDFGGEGKVAVKDGAVVLDEGKQMTGIVYKGGDFPKMNYEVALEAKRVSGRDFFCTTTFPVGDTFCSFVVGGWGGTTVGLSSIDGADASTNETNKSKEFKLGQWYKVRIRVTPKKIEAWIDDEKMVDLETVDRKISIRIECNRCRPFGIATWETVGAVRDIRVRSLSEEKKAPEKKPGEAKAGTDIHGDPLPAGAIQRLGTLRFRHDSTAIAYSPGGKFLASGGRGNDIRLFDAVSGKEIRRLVGHRARTYTAPRDPRFPMDALIGATGEGGVNSVAFSPDGKLLASGGWDDTVRIWDVASGKELRKIEAHKAMVGRVLFSPDGRHLASRGALDGTVRLWDVTTGLPLHKLVGLSNINPWRFNHDMALAIAPDGKTLAATARNSLVFFDLTSGTEIKRLPSHVYGITVAYSPDGKLLATGGVDEGKDVYSLRIWDVASGKQLRSCALPKNEPPTYLAWEPGNSGKLAAVIAEDDMHIFDAATGKEVVRLNHYWPSRVVYSPDGKTLTSAGSGPTIRQWEAGTGKELRGEYQGHSSGVVAVAITEDGKRVASAGGDIRVWEAGTGKLVQTIPSKGLACLALAPDGKTLAWGGRDRIVHLWDVEASKEVKRLEGHKTALCGLGFSRDGKRLASGDVQSTVRIWNVEDGKVVQEINNQSGTEVLSFAFDPDGKTLLCAGAWNDSSFIPAKGTEITINGKKVKFDGVLNIQGVVMTRKEGYHVMQWDVQTGKEVRKLAGLEETIRSLATSPDGKLIAAASKDGKVCLWDANTGEERLHIVAHPTHADRAFTASPCLAFSPDSKTLASASSDRTIRLWDVGTARERGQLRSSDSAFAALAFSRDGKRLISGSADTGVLVWDVSAAGKPPRDRSTVIPIR